MAATSKFKTAYIKKAKRLIKEQGLSNHKIAKELGVSPATFQTWVRTKKELRTTLRKTREGVEATKKRKVVKLKQLKQLKTFPEYVYKRLDPDVQEYWDRLKQFDKSKSGILKIEALLDRGGLYVRQNIFIHAWIVSGFKISHALKKANITRTTFERWCETPQFKQLVDDIGWYKGNFFEEALMDLVAMRETSAVIHANKTYNRGRGYNEKTEIQVDVKQTKENEFDSLPMNLKKRIRAHYRKKQQQEKE